MCLADRMTPNDIITISRRNNIIKTRSKDKQKSDTKITIQTNHPHVDNNKD